MPLTIATVAANFTRNVEAGLARIEAIVTDARERGATLVVLPDATLGGYLSTFRVTDAGDGARVSGGPSMDGGDDLPPALDPDGPELARVRAVAGPVVVCLGYCEADG